LPAGTSLNATTGVITVTDASLLVAGTTNFTITTTDEDGGKTTNALAVMINADVEAVYTVNAAKNLDSYANADVFATVADADGNITSAIVATGSLPAGTSLDATTGEITVTSASLLVSGTTNFTITTTDVDGGKTTSAVAIIITADVEAVYTVSAAKNLDNYANADVLAAATDADGNIVSAIIATGSLPAGTSLNATTGEITVTNASLLTSGTTNLSITITDEDGGKTTSAIAIVITADNEAVYTVSAAENLDSYVNADVLATVTDTDGNIVGALVTSGSLPAGTSLHATTGVITVTDATLLAAGTTNLSITVTDEDGGQTTQAISIIITDDNEAVYSVNTANNIDSYGNTDVLANVTDADGAIVTAAVASGSLPAGTSLDVVTGIITVTDVSLLAAGTTNFTITVTDEDGGETTTPVSITITADNEAVYTTSPAKNLDSYANADVLATVIDTDGAIVNAVVTTGSLPPGTALNATTGAITVTDASLLTAGTSTIDVTITDEDGGVTTQTIAITFTGDNEAVYNVNPPENSDSYTNADVLASVSDPDGNIVNAVITNGVLPAGITLNTITGTINVTNAALIVAGTTNVEVTVTDEDGGVTTQLISIVITGDFEATYTIAPSKSTDSYSSGEVVASVSDPDGNVSNAVLTNGNLPAGTSLNPVNGTISVVNAGLITPGDYVVDITTTDMIGGTTLHHIVIAFGDDREAVYDVKPTKPVNEYIDGDILASVSDADGNIMTAVLSSGILPAGTMLNPTTGQLSVANALLLQPGTYTLQVTTTDPNGGQTVHPVTLIVLVSSRDLDNDGVLDIHEDGNNDSDLTNDDTDGDGIADYEDTDDDGDGVTTINEDLSNDGDPRNDDTDADGIPNYLDPDDDGDGIPTAEEDGNENGNRNDDDCDEDGLVDYLDPDLCGIKPELGFSPNGDGNNEFWNIRGIDYYSENQVNVFNRWGNLVYETTGYNNTSNSWQGQVNGKLSLGSNAPDGTYFYVIKVNGGKPISGYVIIKR
jgi:gliding motility-associated-like protein